ncbi:MAG: single-stranded DNA-binding protein, partial [Candidatus Acidiferrales bacterium]
YLKKGSQIFVEGRIQSRQWDDKEGNKRTSFEIVANEMRMLGSKSDGGGAGRAAPAHEAGETHEPAAAEEYSTPEPQVSDEDIPF